MNEERTQGPWVTTSEPSLEHSQWADDGRFLFASSDWGHVTRALGAVPMYAWNPGLRVGVMVPVFNWHGLKVGFFGFPVSGQPWDDLPVAEVKEHVSRLGAAMNLNLMRFSQSMRTEADPSMTSARPEVWIESLQSWSAVGSKRLRKDLAFARRCRQQIRVGNARDDMRACYRMYAATVESHGGQLRYTLDYFRTLGRLAAEEGIEVFTSSDEVEGMNGFAVLAMHGTTAYYLHGGTDEVGRRSGVSDLLLERLTMDAREKGASRLSLMSSPWEQAGLVKFKQKWGDQHGLSVTYDVPSGVLGTCVRLATRWQARRDRNSAALRMRVAGATCP